MDTRPFRRLRLANPVGDLLRGWRLICPSGKISKNLSSPLAKNISRFARNSLSDSNRPALLEGRFVVVTNVGCGIAAKPCGLSASTLARTP